MLTREEVRVSVMNALAAKRRRDVGELEDMLRAAGPECPCDSQWLVKAGVGAARALGVPFEVRAKDAWAFKSVETLTSYLHGVVEEAGAA